MTAPLIWIIFPLLAGFLLLLLPNQRLVVYIGAGIALLLTVLALWLPPDSVRQIGPVVLRMDSTLTLVGRQISLTSAQQIMLVLVYGIGAFWFFGTLAAGNARRIIPFGLVVTALLVASLAVQPFLYAALLIELAVMLSIPLLIQPETPPGRGLIRFLMYQTLAMPFILFAGFLLSGVDVGPADIGHIIPAAVLLGLGFAFLLAVFPLYTWVPLLVEEVSPYAAGFILILFPTFSLIFGLNFIDNYSWLHDPASLQFSNILQVVGLLMMTTSGVWAAFQRHLGRILAYSIVAETGVSLVAISLPDKQLGLQIFFYLIAPRALALGIWAIAISMFKEKAPDLQFASLQGIVRTYPVATAGLVLANLSLIGAPLLASFPIRQLLWEKLAATSFPPAIWFGIASLGLWLGALRTLMALVQLQPDIPWKSSETWAQRILIGLGLLGLFVLGLFPQWVQPLLTNLPAMFEHIGK
jgi:formate hydrogenlyase subunit 3/multisubunit Na+/H+ antiporter MnhD subunit